MPSPVVLLVNVKACEGSLSFNDELVFGFKKMAISSYFQKRMSSCCSSWSSSSRLATVRKASKRLAEYEYTWRVMMSSSVERQATGSGKGSGKPRRAPARRHRQLGATRSLVGLLRRHSTSSLPFQRTRRGLMNL